MHKNYSKDVSFAAKQRTYNNREEDAPHLYISWSLHCFRPMTRRYATSVAVESNDFFPMDVMRNVANRGESQWLKT
jgi:hypothetical protein